MSALQDRFRKKAVYERGVIACRKCATPIYIRHFAGLPDEFSVRCQKCGDRGFYAKRAVAIETAPERRKKPRRESDR